MGDTLKLTAETGDLIQGSRGGRVNIHGCWLSEGVCGGVIDMACHKLPRPEDFKGLVRWDTDGLRNGRTNGREVDTCRRPTAH